MRRTLLHLHSPKVELYGVIPTFITYSQFWAPGYKYSGSLTGSVWGRVLVVLIGTGLAPAKRTAKQALRVIQLDDDASFRRDHEAPRTQILVVYRFQSIATLA